MTEELLMNERVRKQNSKTVVVAARLTRSEEARVAERASAAGKTVSEWVRQMVLEALETSPGELRLMAFVTAQTGAVRKALEEWQQNKELSDANVQERIRRLSIETALDDAKATERMLELKRKERDALAQGGVM